MGERLSHIGVWVRDSVRKFRTCVTSFTSRGTHESCQRRLVCIQICACACVCMFASAYCLYTPTHAHIYAKTHSHTHAYIRTRAHAHARTHAHAHTCTHARTFTPIDTRTQITHTDTHTRTHTHQRISIIVVANIHLLSKFVKHSQFQNVAMARCGAHRRFSERVWHFPTCIKML